jgi:hypothetical protein
MVPSYYSLSIMKVVGVKHRVVGMWLLITRESKRRIVLLVPPIEMDGMTVFQFLQKIFRRNSTTMLTARK